MESEAVSKDRRERKDARRNLERVLQAAHELFAEQGVDVTIEAVARRAGVGVGTVYRRFPSKEHLFAAVSHAACADTHRCLAEAAASTSDPIAKLRALVIVHYRRSAEAASLLDLHVIPTAERQHSGAQLEQQQLYLTLHHMLQHVIVEGQRQGIIREGDPAVLAALCLEVLHPRVVQHLRRVVDGDVDELAEHAVRFILHGLGVRAHQCTE